MLHTALNLPSINPRIRIDVAGKEQIFDPLRKRFVALTPEEWVRQHMIGYLLDHLQFPASLVAVEVPLKYNRLKKRADLVVYRKDGKPGLIVECKAPAVQLSREVLEQAAMYNMPFGVAYIILTNGLQHHILFINRAEGKVEFLEHFPQFDEL